MLMYGEGWWRDEYGIWDIQVVLYIFKHLPEFAHDGRLLCLHLTLVHYSPSRSPSTLPKSPKLPNLFRLHHLPKIP